MPSHQVAILFGLQQWNKVYPRPHLLACQLTITILAHPFDHRAAHREPIEHHEHTSLPSFPFHTRRTRMSLSNPRPRGTLMVGSPVRADCACTGRGRSRRPAACLEAWWAKWERANAGGLSSTGAFNCSGEVEGACDAAGKTSDRMHESCAMVWILEKQTSLRFYSLTK